jgi:hypothetical protein
MAATTRAQFAVDLFKKLGLSLYDGGSSFKDEGYLGGVLGALEHAGVINGTSSDTFSGDAEVTRGEAFTMTARGYGLADANTSVADASAALQEAGIVKGYGGKGTLGLADAFDKNHVGSLFDQLDAYQADNSDAPLVAVNDDNVAAGVGKAQDAAVMADPEFAASLRGFGLSESQINSTHDFQTTAVNNRIAELSDIYGNQTEKAAEGINTSAEQRGMFRGGKRLTDLAESADDIDAARSSTENSMIRERDVLDLDKTNELADLARKKAEQEAAARGRLGDAEVDRYLTEYAAEQESTV